MTTYYRGMDVLVTSEAFVRMGYGACRFPIDELYDVRVVRGEPHPARTISARCAVGAALCAVASWPFLDDPKNLMIAVLAVAAPGVVSVGCVHWAPRTQEIRAMYRSHDVGLYASTNSLTFGQVKRALVRALEERSTRHEEANDLYK